MAVRLNPANDGPPVSPPSGGGDVEGFRVPSRPSDGQSFELGQSLSN